MNEIDLLKQEIDVLKEWRFQKERQQITFPLDKISTDMLLGLLSTSSQVLPIGSIYANKTNSANPSTYLGYGTWTAVEGYVIAGYKSGDPNFGTAGSTVGSSTHTLTDAELPAHVYNITGTASGAWAVAPGATYGTATGSGTAHNNIQPTLVCYVWERTA